MSDFKGRRFPTDVILICVRWNCKYRISYRDLEEMISERGVMVDDAIGEAVSRQGAETAQGLPAGAHQHRPNRSPWKGPPRARAHWAKGVGHRQVNMGPLPVQLKRRRGAARQSQVKTESPTAAASLRSQAYQPAS